MRKYKTKEEAINARRQKDRERYFREKEKRLKRAKVWAKNNPDKIKEKTKRQWKEIKNNPIRYDKYKARLKRFRNKLRFEVLNHYSNGKMCCSCCGENHNEFLAVDHIKNNGYEHRKKIGGNIYKWLKANNYPEGFQILCHNCNFAKGIYGICPHSKL